jgi:hypothetical protein
MENAMKKLITLGLVSLAALAAVPALADQAPAKPMHHGPTTRAEAQAEVKAHFDKFDTNKDGTVTKAEFDASKSAMKAQWQAKGAERHGERFAALDADKDGQLSRAEWDAKGAGPAGKARRDGDHPGRGKTRMINADGQRWFDKLDANKDGKVTLAEATTARLAMFDKVDANKDGTISPEEHKAARETMRAKWQAEKKS